MQLSFPIFSDCCTICTWLQLKYSFYDPFHKLMQNKHRWENCGIESCKWSTDGGLIFPSSSSPHPQCSTPKCEPFLNKKICYISVLKQWFWGLFGWGFGSSLPSVVLALLTDFLECLWLPSPSAFILSSPVLKYVLFLLTPCRSFFQNARGKFAKAESSKHPVQRSAPYHQCWWAVSLLQVLEASSVSQVSTLKQMSFLLWVNTTLLM